MTFLEGVSPVAKSIEIENGFPQFELSGPFSTIDESLKVTNVLFCIRDRDPEASLICKNNGMTFTLILCCDFRELSFLVGGCKFLGSTSNISHLR